MEGAIGAIFTNQMLCLRPSEITLGTEDVEKPLSFWGLAHRPTNRGFDPSTKLVKGGGSAPRPHKGLRSRARNEFAPSCRHIIYATGYSCVGLPILLCHRFNQNAI